MITIDDLNQYISQSVKEEKRMKTFWFVSVEPTTDSFIIIEKLFEIKIIDIMMHFQDRHLIIPRNLNVNEWVS